MKLSYLKEFILLARELNFTKAAQLLYITQPVLSKHIATIEEDIGFKLFERNNQNVLLTDIGKIFLEDASTIVDTYEKCLNKINLAANGIEKTLTIGFLDAAVREIIVPTVNAFESSFPQSHLQLFSYEYGDDIRALERNEIDMALTLDLDQKLISKYASHTISDDVLAVVLPKNHPLAGEESLYMEQLKNESFILPMQKQFPGIIDRFHDLIYHINPQARVIGQKTYKDTLILLVEAQQGISMMPYHLHKFAGANVQFVKLKDEAAQFHIVAIHNKQNQSMLIHQFLDILKEIINER